MIKLLAIAFLAGSFFTPLQTKSIYDFKVPSLNGGTIDFADFKGKKILIVNTARNTKTWKHCIKNMMESW